MNCVAKIQMTPTQRVSDINTTSSTLPNRDQVATPIAYWAATATLLRASNKSIKKHKQYPQA